MPAFNGIPVDEPAKGPRFKGEPVSQGNDQWERGTLLPIEKNRRTGEWRFAWPQVAVDIGSALTLPGDVASGKVEVDLQNPSDELIGRSLGLAALPAMGATAGPSLEAARVAAGGMNGGAKTLLQQALKDDQIDPRAIPDLLQQIGPDAMVGDLGPNVQTLGKAVATMPGPGQKILLDELRKRAAERNFRIIGEVDQTLGKSVTPTQYSAGVKAAQQELSPYYEKAFQNAKAVDTADIALNLDSEAVTARGEAQNVAKQLRAMLNVTGTDQLDRYPRTLFEVRKAIDGMFDTVQDGNARRILSQTRKQVDELLKGSVPDIKKLDEAFSLLAKQKEAFDTGQTILDSGRTALRPAEVQSIVEQSTPPALKALSMGARAEIDRIIGTTANDLVALKRALGGEGDWNRDRLAAVFGKEKADKLLNVVMREMRYKQLEDDALSGSRTQVLKAGQERIAGKEPKPSVIKSLMDLKPGSAVFAGADKSAGLISEAMRTARNKALAEALVSKDGPAIGRELMSRDPGLLMQLAPQLYARLLLETGEAPALNPFSGQ